MPLSTSSSQTSTNPFPDTPQCIGQLECPLTKIPRSMLPQLLQSPSTSWVSLQPISDLIVVALPNTTKSIGSLPQPLSGILARFLDHPSIYGPAGGCSLTLPTNELRKLYIEGVLHVDQSTSQTSFKLALLLFSFGEYILDIGRSIVTSFISLRRPPRYDPTQHNGIFLASLSTTPSPLDNSVFSYDHSLLDIPSGCDLTPVQPPQGILKTQLLTHQSQGLAFLLDRKLNTSTSAAALWKRSQTNSHHLWVMKISGETLALPTAQDRPPMILGSILADDMGLGKTIQALSLVASTLIQAGQYNLEQLNPSLSALPPHQATLIICPPRVLTNWKQEIIKHTHKGTIPMVVYHGRSRNKLTPNQLQEAMIILTTYNLVAIDFAKLDSTPSVFFSNRWYRIILDEAQ